MPNFRNDLLYSQFLTVQYSLVRSIGIVYWHFCVMLYIFEDNIKKWEYVKQHKLEKMATNYSLQQWQDLIERINSYMDNCIVCSVNQE